MMYLVIVDGYGRIGVLEAEEHVAWDSEELAWADARVIWGARFHKCMACGGDGALETHEIARGPHRQKAMREPATWLRLCRACHDKMGTAEWPIERQLQLKADCDPDYYDLAAVNRCRAREEDAITQEQVDGA